MTQYCSVRVYALVIFVLSLIACASPDNIEPPTPLESFSASARVETVWKARLSSQVNLSAYTLSPFVSDELVYAIDNKGLLLALSRENGSEQWRKQLDRDISVGVAGDANNLYFGTLQGDLIALNQRDGDELWRSKMTTEIIALPSAGGGHVVARSIDGRVTLFSSEDGTTKWTYNRNVPALTVRGNSQALILGDGVLLGLDSGKLLALSLEAGKPFWEVSLSESSGRSEIERLSDVDAAIQIDERYVYAAGFQGNLAQIDPARGRIVWARELSTIAGFRLHEDAIYVSDADSNVWALESNSGTSVWKQEKLRYRQLTAPVPVGDYVMIADLEGYAHWLSRFDGRLVARKRIGDSKIVAAATSLDDVVYVQTQHGFVSALKVVKD